LRKKFYQPVANWGLHSPLGRGFLTGEITDPEHLSSDDFRLKIPRFQGENFQKNLEIVTVIRRIAKLHNATLAQIALAWVLMKGEDIIPIPGTKRIRFLEENLNAGDVQLTHEEIRELDGIRSYGERSPEINRKYIQK
jgi:aryl-alcohol dehydrogenase-like predicted oxidoreductase